MIVDICSVPNIRDLNLDNRGSSWYSSEPHETVMGFSKASHGILIASGILIGPSWDPYKGGTKNH